MGAHHHFPATRSPIRRSSKGTTFIHDRSIPSAFGVCPNSWIASDGKLEAFFQARLQ